LAATNLFKTPISLPGIIEPAIILKVQSSVGGRVEVLHVKENQHVPKNQLLLTLNNDTQKRQLELTLLQHKVNENNVIDRKRQLKLANVQIKVDENNVKDRKNQLEVSRNNVKDLEASLKDILRRLKDEETLFEQGSSTRSQLDVLQLQYFKGEIALKNSILGLERAILNVDNTILSLERSREDIQGSELSVENALIAVERSSHDVELSEDALEDTLIKAKIGGIITAKSFQEGEVITAGAVLFQIIDIKQVEIKIQLGEGDLPMISEGQAVVFTTPGYRDIEFSGIIERISWTADPETGRFPLYIKAANPGLKLRAGMSAKVYLLRQK
jgi:multidrug efflux pump subunit AcrA (membrane-fusion protein)